MKITDGYVHFWHYYVMYFTEFYSQNTLTPYFIIDCVFFKINISRISKAEW